MTAVDEVSTALAITDEERELLDSAIDRMVSKTAEWDIKIEKPVWFRLQFNADACAKLDDIIAPVFDGLRARKVDDFAEKLFDRLAYRTTVMNEHGFEIGILGLRLMDTLECVIAMKGKYRGKPCVSYTYDKKKATEELRKRKLLK